MRYKIQDTRYKIFQIGNCPKSWNLFGDETAINHIRCTGFSVAVYPANQFQFIGHSQLINSPVGFLWNGHQPGISCILYLVSCILYLVSCIFYLVSCVRNAPCFYSLASFKRSDRVMPSKKSSIILSSRSHMGRVWQQVDREQAEGPWVVQETVARLPSVSFKIPPTV